MLTTRAMSRVQFSANSDLCPANGRINFSGVQLMEKWPSDGLARAHCKAGRANGEQIECRPANLLRCLLPFVPAEIGLALAGPNERAGIWRKRQGKKIKSGLDFFASDFPFKERRPFDLDIVP